MKLNSLFNIGERVIFYLDDNLHSDEFYVRAIIFTNMKVRYSLFYKPQNTTLHNIDSIFCEKYINSEGETESIEFEGDNYS